MSTKHIHVCAIAFQLTKNGEWQRGIAVLSEPGSSRLITLIGEDGAAITAPDGGSPAVRQWHSCPSFGAQTFIID